MSPNTSRRRRLPSESRTLRSRNLSSSKLGPASMPRTTRMMTSSVIACIEGCAAKRRPTGHASISRAAISSIRVP